ncbi:hypothetical protein EUBHAL_01851 [Anaerobutyricum hallii DSM 3353]|uniref:Uncharacterized protein n=1 Tax=Anaerobutyricum hallii DSM 3353 TaxID=411469 RepID=C0EWR2_9FIRM|nr:hypothetical protein EUBHAL_01851 [Anaerobutyricum hallii DSM 3353]
MKNKTEGIEYPENEILTLLQQPKNNFQRGILFYICDSIFAVIESQI